jgi:Fe-S cluster assembly iron-binding protein IscA
MKHRPPTSVRPLLPIMVCLLALPLAGQSTLGELRLRVTDPRGSGIETEVQVVSEVNQYDSTLATDDSGVLIAKHLPFGLY